MLIKVNYTLHNKWVERLTTWQHMYGRAIYFLSTLLIPYIKVVGLAEHVITTEVQKEKTLNQSKKSM